jgi:hypothetical protein
MLQLSENVQNFFNTDYLQTQLVLFEQLSQEAKDLIVTTMLKLDEIRTIECRIISVEELTDAFTKTGHFEIARAWYGKWLLDKAEVMEETA